MITALLTFFVFRIHTEKITFESTLTNITHCTPDSVWGKSLKFYVVWKQLAIIGRTNKSTRENTGNCIFNL